MANLIVTTRLRRSNIRDECRRCKVDKNFISFHSFRKKISDLFRVCLDESARFYYTDQHENQVAFSSDEELELAYLFAQNNELKIIVEDFLAFVSLSGSMVDDSESGLTPTSGEELSDPCYSDYQQENSFREVRTSYHSEALYTANLQFSRNRNSQSRPEAHYNVPANPRSSRQFNQLDEFKKCEKDDVKQKQSHMPSISQRTAGGMKRNEGQNTAIKQSMVAQTRSKSFLIQELNYSVASSSTTSSDNEKQSVPKETSQSAFRTRTLKSESHNDSARGRITTSSAPRMDSSAHSLELPAKNRSMPETSSESVPHRVLETQGKGKNSKSDVKSDSDNYGDTMTQSLQKPTPATGTKDHSPLTKAVEEHGNRSGKGANQNGLRGDVKSKKSLYMRRQTGVERSPLSAVPNQNSMLAKPAGMVNTKSQQTQLPQRVSPDGSENERQSIRNEAVPLTPTKKVPARKGRNQHFNRSDDKRNIETSHLDPWAKRSDESSSLKLQIKRPTLECLGQILLTAVVIGFALFLRR